MLFLPQAEVEDAHGVDPDWVSGWYFRRPLHYGVGLNMVAGADGSSGGRAYWVHRLRSQRGPKIGLNVGNADAVELDVLFVHDVAVLSNANHLAKPPASHYSERSG